MRAGFEFIVKTALTSSTGLTKHIRPSNRQPFLHRAHLSTAARLSHQPSPAGGPGKEAHNRYKKESPAERDPRREMDPTPMDVDESTDLPLPEVVEGLLRMTALQRPEALAEAAKTWDARQASTALKVALDLIGDDHREAGFALLMLCRRHLTKDESVGRICLAAVGERSNAVAGVAVLQKLLPEAWPASAIAVTTLVAAAVAWLAETDLLRKPLVAFLWERPLAQTDGQSAFFACGLQRLGRHPSAHLVAALLHVLGSVKDQDEVQRGLAAKVLRFPAPQLEGAGYALAAGGAVALAAFYARADAGPLALGAARHYAAHKNHLDVAEAAIAACPAPCIRAAEAHAATLRDRATSSEDITRVDASLRYLLLRKPELRGPWMRALIPDAAADRAAAARAARGPASAPALVGKPQPPGLANLGNSCYANAICRALHATAPLRRLLLENSRLDADAPVTSELRKLAALLSKSTRPHIRPEQFRDRLREPFCSYGQQDAAEFLHYIMEALEAEQGGLSKELLDGVFGGQLETVLTCSECGTRSSSKTDLGGLLSVSVPDDRTIRKNDSVALPLPAQKPAQLYHLIRDQCLASETLEGDSAYFCDCCAMKVEAKKTSSISSAPRHLIVGLGRFAYDIATQTRRKVGTRVDCPLQLHVADFEYTLYAVVVHSGSTPHHGHYYAYCRDSASAEKWRKFDDESVEDCVDDDPRQHKTNRSPYILFYARENGDDPAAGPWSTDLKRFVEMDNEAAKTDARPKTPPLLLTNGPCIGPMPRPRPPPPPPGGPAEPYAAAGFKLDFGGGGGGVC